MSVYGGYGTPPDPAHPSMDLELEPAANAFKSIKRKRAEFDPDPNDHFYEPAYIQQQTRVMINLLKEYTDENGSHIYGPFLSLPDRDAFPDYYQIVKKPVSITEVEERLANNEYTSLHPARDDLNQMFNNAKHYNQNGSDIYNAAQKLQKALKIYWKGLQGTGPDGLAEVDSPAPTPSTPQSAQPPAKRGRPTNAYLEAQAAADPVKYWMQSTLKKLIEHPDEDGRPHSEFFMVLPPREIFPDYYQIIEHPIAFSQLQSKVKKGNYTTNYDGFIRDVNRVFSNAKTYNDESALVYQDAVVLEKLFEKLQRSSPVKASPAAQPKVTLRFGQGNRPTPSATPAAESPAPDSLPISASNQHDKITLKFGASNQSAKASPVNGAAELPQASEKVESPASGLEVSGDAPAQPLQTKRHAQIFLPPKRSVSRQLSDPAATQYSARGAAQANATSWSVNVVDQSPLPPPVTQRVPKVLTQFGSTSHCHLPVFHIKTYPHASSSSVLLNGFLRQHSITVPKETVSLNVVAANSVAPLASTSKNTWQILPSSDDPCLQDDEAGSNRGARPSKTRALSAHLNVVARARPAGTLIKQEAANAETDGPYTLANFSCKLAKHPVSTLEFIATVAGQENPQVYRLFVIRAQ